MATSIKLLDVTRLHQEEDLGFHGMAYPILVLTTDSVLQPRIQDYRTSIDAFDAAIKQERASIITEEIKKLDYQIGNTYHGFHDIVRRMLHHLDASKVAAAKKVDFVLKKYEINGDPTSLALVEQLEVFANMIDDLKTMSLMEALEQINAQSWVNDLSTYNENMFNLYSQRTDSTSTFVAGLSKQCRKVTDDNYLSCTSYINALIGVNGTSEFEQVVVKLNRLIEEMKVVLASRKTVNETHRNHNLSYADVSDIPVQIYTGNKITPSFEVFIHGERLSNVTDYAAEYKDNVAVGTASVVIKGIGNYTGKKTVTFNIARTL